MNRVLYQTFAVLSWFSVLTSVPAPARAEASDKNIVSRTAEVDGVKLHYLTAGHGPAVILLHGYAETSRMWRPDHSVVGGEIYRNRAGSAGYW